MSLFLVEIVPTTADANAALSTLADVHNRLNGSPAEFIEAQVTTGGERIFVIAEAASADQVSSALEGLDAAEIADPASVRLVGAELDDIKSARPEAGYLVEWDLPAELDMDTYLANKKAKSPLYANVPEVSFLRTYVREDMAKCLCFYNGPDEAAVERAREAVSTPIDRLHSLVELPGAVKL